MVFKLNHLGKVKTSFMVNPETLTQAKVHAARVHFSVGEIMGEALKEYLVKHAKDKTWEDQLREKFERESNEEIQRGMTEYLRQKQTQGGVIKGIA